MFPVWQRASSDKIVKDPPPPPFAFGALRRFAFQRSERGGGIWLDPAVGCAMCFLSSCRTYPDIAIYQLVVRFNWVQILPVICPYWFCHFLTAIHFLPISSIYSIHSIAIKGFFEKQDGCHRNVQELLKLFCYILKHVHACTYMPACTCPVWLVRPRLKYRVS